MLTKVLLILLDMSIILPPRIERPHVESEMGPSAGHDDVYGPKPQDAKKKVPSEEITPATIDTHQNLGKLPATSQILDSILNNSDYKLHPGIDISYPENEMMYKWKDFKLEINESNSWKLFQFNFTGVSNETETISTIAGDLNEEPRDLLRIAPRAALENLFTHTDQVKAVETLSSLFPECR